MNVYCIKCNHRLMVPQSDNCYACLGCESIIQIEPVKSCDDGGCSII